MNRKYTTRSDIIADRLRHSRNPVERRSLFRGRTYHQGFPVLLDTKQFIEHMHLLGPTGCGKTSMGIEPIVRQLMPLNDGPIVIFDGKGDIGLFNSARHMAYLYDRDFKWFTNRPSRSTFVFNPWDNRLMQRLTLTDILGLVTQSLNLHHGQDYGRAWFSINARNLLRHAILETIPGADQLNVANMTGQTRLFPKYGPIQSFRDLHGILKDLTRDNDEFKAAQHLAFIVECLCDLEQLNLAPNTHPNHPALDHAIFMPEVIEKKQIIYFYLAGALDDAAVSEIAKLALYSLYAAVVDYCERNGKKPRVYTIWDEAQIMIAKNIEYVLTQSRSHGMACIMAHQAMSQLNPPGGVDLRELVMQCTLIKQIFGVRDPWLMEYITRTAGTTKYYRRGYDVSSADALAGCIDPAYACLDHDNQRRVRIQEYTGPRLSNEDIMRVSRHPNLSLLLNGQPTRLCPFRGWFPLFTDWPIPMSLREEYERQAWPKKTDATIETSRFRPANEVPESATTSQALPGPNKKDVADALDAVWQDIRHNGPI